MRRLGGDGGKDVGFTLRGSTGPRPPPPPLPIADEAAAASALVDCDDGGCCCDCSMAAGVGLPLLALVLEQKGPAAATGEGTTTNAETNWRVESTTAAAASSAMAMAGAGSGGRMCLCVCLWVWELGVRIWRLEQRMSKPASRSFKRSRRVRPDLLIELRGTARLGACSAAPIRSIRSAIDRLDRFGRGGSTKPYTPSRLRPTSRFKQAVGMSGRARKSPGRTRPPGRGQRVSARSDLAASHSRTL